MLVLQWKKETFAGNKINRLPQDQLLSVKCLPWMAHCLSFPGFSFASAILFSSVLPSSWGRNSYESLWGIGLFPCVYSVLSQRQKSSQPSSYKWKKINQLAEPWKLPDTMKINEFSWGDFDHVWFYLHC